MLGPSARRHQPYSSGGSWENALVRYAASNVDLVFVVEPHNGLGRAERAKKTLGLTSRGLCRESRAESLTGYPHRSVELSAVASMGIPVFAVFGTDYAPRMAGRGAQRRGGSGCNRADPLLDQGPRRFDWIEIVRVGRQKLECRAALFDQVADASVLMRPQVVHDDDVAHAQFGHQAALHPRDEALRVGCLPGGAHRQPPIRSNRADHRQIVAPVHRPGIHDDVASLHPRVRAAHGEIRTRFIDKHQPLRVDQRDPPAERFAFGVDVGAVLLCGPRTFFLNTYPLRCRARRMLDRWTRSARSTRPLYARLSSSVVASGVSRTTRSNTATSTGDVRPPLLGSGATVPVSRRRTIHRSSVHGFNEKRSATAVCDSSPSSYARTARSRSSIGNGFGMCIRDHRLADNSTDFRG